MEILIGLGFLTGVGLRVAILLLFLQVPSTMAPIFLLPDRVFTIIPVALTIEGGEYIVKNLVLISAALVTGATARGGYLVTERGEPDAPA